MLKFTPLGALCAALLAGPVSAHDLHSHNHVVYNNNVITVACYRGPWTEVLWDRPLPQFYDSLTNAGYSPERALAIANRVCRDRNLVGNTEALKREATRVISASPRN